MESGLEDRNNRNCNEKVRILGYRLNGVRPRRPEQFDLQTWHLTRDQRVSMESGLEDRNNAESGQWKTASTVRSQWSPAQKTGTISIPTLVVGFY